MDNTVSFYFAILTILLIYFINNLNLSFSNVIAITSTIIIVYLSYNYVNDNKTSTLLLYEDKLNNIYPKPKFFHLDINFIDIISNLQDLRELNPSAFNSLVLTIDNFLKIENDILNKGVYLPKENIDVILDLKRSAINNLHSFYFNVPVSKIYDLKLSNGLKSLNSLFDTHIHSMISHANKNYKYNNITTDTHFLQNSNIPRPIDNLRDYNSFFFY